MLSSNEKKLIYMLAFVLVFCATALFFYLLITRPNTGLNALNKQILEIENSVKNLTKTDNDDEDLLSRIELIETEIEKERNRFYVPGEIEIASFGLQVKQLIAKNMLTINNQRTISQKDITFIEFNCVGKANQITNFLKGVSTAEKYWRIDSLTIQSKSIDGNIDARMRITYETINTNSN